MDFDYTEIKNINVPTQQEFGEMNAEQLIYWRDKLHPFYYHRSEILFNIGFQEWKKVICWPFIYRRLEERD